MNMFRKWMIIICSKDTQAIHKSSGNADFISQFKEVLVAFFFSTRQGSDIWICIMISDTVF